MKPFSNKTEQVLQSANDSFEFIHSLYELARWSPDHALPHRSSTPYEARSEEDQRNEKVVVCHDIPGGICEEAHT